MTQGVGAQTSAGLLAFQFARIAPIEANGHVAGVTENPVIRKAVLIPDPAVYRGAGASYGRAVLHARAIDAEFFYDKNVRQRMSRCNP